MAVTDRFKDATWITNDKIIIGGAGGISSWLTLFLSRIGYKLHVYDFDIFEEHNMGGQFVDTKHIGISKVKSLQELCYHFSGNNINIYDKKFEYNTSKHKYMMAGFDNMKARKDMFNTWFDYCKYNNIKDALFIDGSSVILLSL
jgi:tRNA A37 threonylcarbamoyladenosine dehydratase